MAIYLISKIKPKNEGTFALMDAADIEMEDGTRLEAYLDKLSTKVWSLELTPGPEGPQGEAGDDGGHYIPSVADNGDGTFTVSFTPSIEGMLAIAPVVVTMPVADITVDALADPYSTNPIQSKAVATIDLEIRQILEKEHAPRLMPEVTAEDNDKILQVVDGAWTKVAMADSAVKTYIDEYINEALGGEY